MESDPIGLEGGLNTFGYVEGNPNSYIDFYGLSSTSVIPTVCRGWSCAAAAVAQECIGLAPNLTNAWLDLQRQQTELIASGLGALFKEKGNKAQDSGKNEKHGDGGRAKDKAKDRIAELEEQSRNASGNERKKIEQKIKNIKRDAARKAKGEEHSRAAKR